MARKVPILHTNEELARIPVLTVAQTARLLDLSAATIRRYLKKGRIAGKQIRKQWYIPSTQFLAANTQDQRKG